MDNTHLTIDLDFFFSDDVFSCPELLENFIHSMQNVLKLNVPIKVFEFHHEILPFINKTQFTRILNVDLHSDICEQYNAVKLYEGNWANYYKFRSSAEFVWISPSTELDKEVRCDFQPENSFLALAKRTFPYAKTSRDVRRKLTSNWLSKFDITSVSIVYSTEYWSHNSCSYIPSIMAMFPQIKLGKILKR